MSGSAFVSAPASCAGAFVSALLAALVRWSICVRLGHTVRHFGLEPGAGAFLVRLDGLRGTRARVGRITGGGYSQQYCADAFLCIFFFIGR